MKVKFSHALEDMTGLFGLYLGVGEGDEKIVHVHNKPSLSDHILEGVIHELLEHGGRVAETKEHDCQLKESFVHDKDCFPLVAIPDVDIVIPPVNVEFSEVVSVF